MPDTRLRPAKHPLADLNAANLGEFKNEFNGSQANVRMLVLLSPT
jgi:hypothetical protein